MQSWAASKRYPNVTFYCINICEMESKGRGPVIGKEFAISYQMKDIINGYFELSKTPTFGQLGCSGFIFANGDGNVIEKATPAFMQYGPNAFQWVERMLLKYQSGGSNNNSNNSELPLDAIRVIVKGLKAQPQLNGLKGFVVRRDTNNNDRFIILLDNGNQISIKSSNFDEVEEDEDDSGGGSCGGGGGCGTNGIRGCSGGPTSGGCCNGNSGDSCSMEAKCNTNTAPSTNDTSTPSCSSSACSDDRLQSLVNQPMALLNIPSIDHEHTECEEALHTFIQKRTTTALKAFLDILIKHFIHEEELMRDVGFGGAKVVSSDEGGINSSMSAMTAYRSCSGSSWYT